MKTQINEIKRMQQLAGVLNESHPNLQENKMGLNYNEIEELLNDILEDYLDGVAGDADEDGNIDAGDGTGLYPTKESLISDFIIFIESSKDFYKN
jgi:hypothetical protein